MKVLIVEDDIEIQGLISHFFKREGYEVEAVSDGLDALRTLKEFKPDLVILDQVLPSLGGINFIKIVKDLPEEYGIPHVIMLSAKTGIEDILAGLEAGASDYMKKPFDPRELLLRAKKLTFKKIDTTKKHKFEGIVIDEDSHLVTENGAEVELSKKEYDFLNLLVKNQGIVLSREKIISKVWNSNYYPGDRSADIYVSRLRLKLKSISKSIHTVKGVGYKLKKIA